VENNVVKNSKYFFLNPIMIIELSILINSINNTIYSQTTYGGAYLPASDTLRGLIVFAKFKNDPWSDNTIWNINGFPNYTDSIKNPAIPYSLPHYFNSMSNGTFHLVLDTFPNVVVTTYTEQEYKDQSKHYGEANLDIVKIIDSSVNWSKYDKWTRDGTNTFRKNPETKIPDGKVDLLYIIYRHVNNHNDFTQHGNTTGIASLGDNSMRAYATHDKKQILEGYPGSGVTIFSGGELNLERMLPIAAHELGHYLFGTYFNGYGLEGENVSHYSPTMSSLERQRLGYSVTISEVSNGTVNIGDYLTTNTAYKMSIPNSGEYFLIENHQKISLYDAVGGWNDHRHDATGKGLYVFHVKPIGGDWTTEVELADGKWNWECCSKLHPDGSSTTLNVYWKTTPDRFAPSGSHQDKYICFPVDSCPGVTRLTWSMFHEIYAGDQSDAFNLNYNTLFSPWSNPASDITGNTNTDRALQILSQNNGTFTVQFFIGNAVNAPPARPMNTKISIDILNYPTITWCANSEPDLTGYNIYRAVVYPGSGASSYSKLNSTLLSTATLSYYDNSSLPAGISSGKDVNYYYYIKAVDNQSYESCPSDTVNIYYGKTVSKTIK
jgi:hypothetical protein